MRDDEGAMLGRGLSEYDEEMRIDVQCLRGQ